MSKRTLATGLIPALLCPGLVVAQAERTPLPLVLEEVIVTAQKRSENVQDIPLTINVVTAEALDNFSIRDTNDLAASVPGLTIQHTPQNLSQVSIRGLGTGSGGESLDQSVGLFIDGIWAGRIREFQAALFDVQRIEVIKGTQTTLLGKNTSLGAVSIVSQRPGQVFGGYLQGDYEFEFDSRYITGAVDLPTGFGDYRLAVNYVDEGGYVDNRATGNEVPEREQTTIRASAQYAVGENGSLWLNYQYDDLEILGDAFQPDTDSTGFLDSMDPGTDIGVDQDKNAFTSYGDSGDAEDEQDSWRFVVQYDHDIGDYRLTSLSGWTDYDNDRLTDSDWLSVDYLTTVYSSDYEQFSQELRITSPDDGRLNYIAGLFYLDSTLDYSTITDTRFPDPFTFNGLPIDGANLKNYDQDTEVWSLFGQGTLDISDRWRATLGLRYTEEEKDAVWERIRTRSSDRLFGDVVADLLAPEVPPTPLERDEDNLDGSINVQFDLSDSTMVFASWARGSKSGGFSTEVILPEDAEFETEEAETTEVGMKMILAGGAAVFNASLFYSEIDDFQVVSFVGTGFEVETVPAETKGFELEAQWTPWAGLTLGATATYGDAEEEDSGLRLPYAPEWSGSLNANYEHRLDNPDLVWRATAVLNYRDEQYMQRLERSLDGELTLLDLRIALASTASGWEVALVGRNLLDQQESFGFDFPFFGGLVVPEDTATLGSLNRPLTVALQARYDF